MLLKCTIFVMIFVMIRPQFDDDLQSSPWHSKTGIGHMVTKYPASQITTQVVATYVLKMTETTKNLNVDPITPEQVCTYASLTCKIK